MVNTKEHGAVPPYMLHTAAHRSPRRIPLERGRDIAIQFGVASLLSPLFDFVPNTNAIGALPPGLPPMSGISPFSFFNTIQAQYAYRLPPRWPRSPADHAGFRATPP